MKKLLSLFILLVVIEPLFAEVYQKNSKVSIRAGINSTFTSVAIKHEFSCFPEKLVITPGNVRFVWQQEHQEKCFSQDNPGPYKLAYSDNVYQLAASSNRYQLNYNSLSDEFILKRLAATPGVVYLRR